MVADVSPLFEVPKNGYTCVVRNFLCLLYLPQGMNEAISIETITDADLYPKIASNEIQVTPVVRITSDTVNLSSEQPAIIELLHTVKLSENETNHELIPLYTSTASPKWKELGAKSGCELLEDRITFKVTHFSLYTVISRKPRPSSTITVKPLIPTPIPDQPPTIAKLTISELPGFKLKFSPTSILSDDSEIDIIATAHYDNPALCNDNDYLASSCIELEPCGLNFSEDVSVSMPILNYTEVIENYPDAQLQIWHTDSQANITENDTQMLWNLTKHSINQDEDGIYIATVFVNHFSYFKAVWNVIDAGVKYLFPSLSNEVKKIKARCQVFMSHEVQIKSFLTFSIAVLYCPFEREPIPDHYEYELAESGLLDFSVLDDEANLHFRIELNELLFPHYHTPTIFAGKFAISGRQRKEFLVKIIANIELKGNLPIGELSLGLQEGSDEGEHTLILIKVI